MKLTRLPPGPVSDAGKYPKPYTFLGLRSGNLSGIAKSRKKRRKTAFQKALARCYERRRLKKQRENIEIIPNGDI